jgi:hypothetical protein
MLSSFSVPRAASSKLTRTVVFLLAPCREPVSGPPPKPPKERIEHPSALATLTAEGAHERAQSFFHRGKASCASAWESAGASTWESTLAAQARFAVLVVHLAAIVIAQHFVRFGHLLELGFGFWIAWIAIGMAFESFFPIGLFDLIGACATRNAESGVEIFFHGLLTLHANRKH